MAWMTTFDQDPAEQPRRLMTRAGVGLGLLFLIGPVSDLKDAPASELATAIRDIAAGRRALDPALAAAAITRGTSPLTGREYDVLAAASQYQTAAEIAQHLHLTDGTVRNYLSSAIRKLRARNRAEAVRIAEQEGWL